MDIIAQCLLDVKVANHLLTTLQGVDMVKSCWRLDALPPSGQK